jgi:hypothetical protein
VCDFVAENILGVGRPARYDLRSHAAVVEWLEKHEDPTFEGVVYRDKNGLRMKCKSKTYVALHHLKDNGNIFMPKNMIPLILKGEMDEILVHFPEAAEKMFDVVETLGGARARMNAVWDAAKGKKTQKEFALYVTKHLPKLCGMLFEARKGVQTPNEVFNASAETLVKKLYP